MRNFGRVYAMSVRQAALFSLVAVLATGAAAQQPLADVKVHGSTVTENNARADTLERRADAYLLTPRHWRKAAQLHRRAGELRSEDPSSVRSFRMAAWLYHATDAPGLARSMMEKAAERAAAVGDVEQAAVSYIDAALLASADDHHRVPKLLRKTRVLLDAPLFPAESRADLLRRIQGTSQLAVAWNESR